MYVIVAGTEGKRRVPAVAACESPMSESVISLIASGPGW